MGDLVVTCTSEHSRNHAAGLLLAQGKTAEEIVSGTKMVVEGIRTAGIVHEIAEREGIEMPITEEVCRVLRGECTAMESLEHLMSRAKIGNGSISERKRLLKAAEKEKYRAIYLAMHL